MNPNALEGLSAEQKRAMAAHVHPYMQASLELQLDAAAGTFKFRLGEEVQHTKGGVYIIVGLPNENVLEASREPSYQYLMADGRICHRCQEEMEDGRFVSVPTGTAAEYYVKYQEEKKNPPEKPKNIIVTFDEFDEWVKSFRVARNDPSTYKSYKEPEWAKQLDGHPIVRVFKDIYEIHVNHSKMRFSRTEVLTIYPDGFLLTGPAPAPEPTVSTEPELEVVTFDEFVAYGRTQLEPYELVNGMPWAFTFKGYPVTHHSDSEYILTPPGGQQLFFKRGELLIAKDGVLDVGQITKPDLI